VGEHGLARAGFAPDKERPPECDGDIDGVAQWPGGDIITGAFKLVEPIILHEKNTSRRQVLTGIILAGGVKGQLTLQNRYYNL
jgi:hypothetical protein